MVDRVFSYPLSHRRDWYTPCPRMKFEFANVLLFIIIIIIIVVLVVVVVVLLLCCCCTTSRSVQRSLNCIVCFPYILSEAVMSVDTELHCYFLYEFPPMVGTFRC